MGIGFLGSPNVIIKRKFRWTLSISTPCGNIPASYCKIAGRPNLEIEETELNFLNAVTWIPGKAKWQPITVTYIDVASRDMQGLYNWMASVYGFQWPVDLPQSEKAGWNGTALLTMYDGCGQEVESWVLGSVFPTSINFGDLAYDTSDVATIELTLRYSEVRFNGGCGLTPPINCCSGCTIPTLLPSENPSSSTIQNSTRLKS
jgi:hypothetical protein